jgi:hypothetical protein
LPIAIAYHSALSILIGVSMRSVFSAARANAHQIVLHSHGLFVLKSSRFAGTSSHPGVAMLLTGNGGVLSLRAQTFRNMQAAQQGYLHSVVRSSAWGAAPRRGGTFHMVSPVPLLDMSMTAATSS